MRIWRLSASVLACWIAAAPAGGDIVDRVMAIVNGHLVTLSDLRASLVLHLIEPAADADARDATVERWIDRVLILQEVERYAPPEPSASDVESRLAGVAAPFGGVAALEAAATRVGVTPAWVRQWVRDDLRIEAYVAQRFAASTEPTDEQIENYFREHPESVRDAAGGGTAAEARRRVRERLVTERRQAVVADWLGDLRRRATIVRPAGR
jgi:peptidyl-prolyl cis-trans isomerase SurA